VRFDFGDLFDALDLDWSEQWQVLHSEADPLTRARHLVLEVATQMDGDDIDGSEEDFVTTLREAVIRFVDPATVDQVRQLPAGIQGLGLVHLLDQYKAAASVSRNRIREADQWIYTFLDRHSREIRKVIADVQVHTIADLVSWCHTHASDWNHPTAA
jgi:hypothetical protein